jgi:hypothetical protein
MLARLGPGEIVPSMGSTCTWAEDDYCCYVREANSAVVCCSTPSKPYLGIDCLYFQSIT